MSQIKKKFIENNAIDNTKLDQSSIYDFASNNGRIKVKTPTENSDAASKEYVDSVLQQVVNSIAKRFVEDLIYSDTTNKVIALAHTPIIFNEVLLLSYNGSAQRYGLDFSISVKDNIAYLCLAPNSTPPSGSSWDIQNLPSEGISNIAVLDDGFVIEYSYL